MVEVYVECKDHTTMHYDHQTIIFFGSNLLFHEMIKHVEVDCHFVYNAVMSRNVYITYQIIDTFTKLLSGSHFSSPYKKLSVTDMYASV